MAENGKALILAVDDEQENLLLLARTLRLRPSLQSVLARSPGQALESIKSSPPRLIIVDQRMPGMTGVEFLLQVRALGCQSPALMLTAYPEDGDVLDAHASGLVHTVVAKPWTPDDLLPILDAVVKASKGPAVR